MNVSDDEKTVQIPFDDLVGLLDQIFSRHGMSKTNARIIATNCAICERDGTTSHGIFRVGGYLASLKSGWVDGAAAPDFREFGPSFIRIDAMNGFAQPALQAAHARIVDMAKASGAVVVAIRNSHHFSALWPDLEPLAEMGFVALSFVSGLACVAPQSGATKVFGTNPIAFAAPRSSGPPVIFDFATSAMSNGDLRLAARDGRRVSVGTGIDSKGRLTQDPQSILEGGALLPFGGHKGAALSLMVEVMASALTGGAFSSEVDFSGHPGAETPRTGQLILVLDPARGGNTNFASRVQTLVENIHASGDVRLPGSRRDALRRCARQHGIPISAADYLRLTELASEIEQDP